MVELLARTGIRVGELAALRDDAMYRLGEHQWLRIEVGKLHNGRNVPLHPLLVGLISDYRAGREPSPTGLLVERAANPLRPAHHPSLCRLGGPARPGWGQCTLTNSATPWPPSAK